MKDSRLQQALAALDDARTTLHDIRGELAREHPIRFQLLAASDDIDRAVNRIKGAMA